MGGKSAEMDCFEGTVSWLRRDSAPPGGLFDAVLPQNGLKKRCFLRLAGSLRRRLAQCLVHRRVSRLLCHRRCKHQQSSHEVTHGTNITYYSELAFHCKLNLSPPHVNERIAFTHCCLSSGRHT